MKRQKNGGVFPLNENFPEKQPLCRGMSFGEYEEICKSLLGFAMKIAQKSRARENSNPLCAGCLMPGSSRMYARCRTRPSRLILIKTMRSRRFSLTSESASEKFESVLRKIPSVYRGQNTCIIITGRSFHIRHRKTKSCRGKIS